MADLAALAAAALERDPTRAAVQCDGQWYDWGTLYALAADVREQLRTCGVGSHASVAFVPRNRPSALAALLALVAEACTIRMIYTFQLPSGIARDVVASHASVVIADADDLGPDTLDALPERAVIALAGMTARCLRTCSTVIECQPTAPQIDILTSGTTGPPKRFALGYETIERHFLDSDLTRQQGESAAALPPFLLYFPIGNITGIYTTLPMLLRGQRVILLERFTLDAWLDYVRQYRPEHSGLPPPFIRQLLEANVPLADLSSLKRLGVGAAPLDPEVQRAFQERYGIPILMSYGATEFAGPVACMTLDLHRDHGESKLGTVGRAMPGVSLRVVDSESGIIQPPRREGLLEVISPRIGRDWIRTSDIATIDEDGFLFLCGRADGAIMRGGFKILPETIERALLLYPAIAEACAVGVVDRRLGQVPAVAVVLRAASIPPTIDDLEAHVRHHLLATHVPAYWQFVEALPRNPSLKIDRRAVAELFEPQLNAHSA